MIFQGVSPAGAGGSGKKAYPQNNVGLRAYTYIVCHTYIVGEIGYVCSHILREAEATVDSFFDVL